MSEENMPEVSEVPEVIVEEKVFNTVRENKQVLVIGGGEIGTAVANVLAAAYIVSIKDLEPIEVIPGLYAMHVCLRYTSEFINIVNDYIKEFNPQKVIIHSTVPVGTCEKIEHPSVYHAPILGRHDKLTRAIRVYILFYSGKENNLKKYFKRVKVKVRYGGKSYKTTELAKLLCLTKYAVLIDLAKKEKELCDSFGVNYNIVVKAFTRNYNQGIKRFGDGRLVRPLLDPPEGKIGGHCTLPALELLKESIGENNGNIKEMVDKILDWNKNL